MAHSKGETMPNLVTISKSFLQWAQSLPHVVIPAGLESDMQEAIAEAEAEVAEHGAHPTCGTLPVSDVWTTPEGLSAKEEMK
jgi:hypothetical protein